MKNILDKINRADEIQANKVELGTHEVELGIIQDLENLFINYNKESSAFEKIVIEIAGAIKEMQRKKVLTDRFGSEIETKYKTLVKDTNNLGLEVPNQILKNYQTFVNVKKFNSDSFLKYNK